MNPTRRITFSALLLSVTVSLACNRNLEAFDPDEKPRDPDLSAIFPDPDPAEDPTGRPVARAPASQRGNIAQPAQGAPVRGRIEVSSELSGSLPGGAVLFIIARRAGVAGGPPLAVRKISSPEFPLDFEIGPENVMIPSLSFAGSLEITARLDSDGNAMTRRPGDLQGEASQAVMPGVDGVVVVLDRRV